MISLRTALRHSRQMLQPSGKDSIWILTTRVQVNCNLFLKYVMITTRPIISYLLYTQFSVVIQRFTTSEVGCRNIRNVKIKPFFFPEMRLYFLMFTTAVCFLFLLNKAIVRMPKLSSFLWFGSPGDSRMAFMIALATCRVGSTV